MSKIITVYDVIFVVGVTIALHLYAEAFKTLDILLAVVTTIWVIVLVYWYILKLDELEKREELERRERLKRGVM